MSGDSGESHTEEGRTREDVIMVDTERPTRGEYVTYAHYFHGEDAVGIYSLMDLATHERLHRHRSPRVSRLG